MFWANRNGFFYVLDRTTGEFLMGKPFVKQNWALGIDEEWPADQEPWSLAEADGRIRDARHPGRHELVSAILQPAHGPVLYVGVGQLPAVSQKGEPGPWVQGQLYNGSSWWAGYGQSAPGVRVAGRAPRQRTAAARGRTFPNYKTEDEGYGAIRAIDPKTGEKKWDFKMVNYTESGVLSTAGDLVFGGGMDGDFVALDAKTGELLWTCLSRRGEFQRADQLRREWKAVHRGQRRRNDVRFCVAGLRPVRFFGSC